MLFIRRSQLLPVTVLVYLCSACSTLHPPATTEAVASQAFLKRLVDKAQTVKRWQMISEVQVRHHNRSWRFKVIWQQSIERFQLRVSAMTGHTLFIANGREGKGVSAIDSRGNRYQADTADLLLKDLLGVTLPMRYLKSWILGSPIADTAVEDAREADGRLLSFVQNGWQVRYYYPSSGESERFKQLQLLSDTTQLVVNIRSFKQPGVSI